MSVNSFNPRLFSSSSSENDMDDVFRHKGGASVVPIGGSMPTAKNQCFTEPTYENVKELKKDDSKTTGKTPALSDSSNVLSRQKARLVTQPGVENPAGASSKNDFSPIFEEVTQLPLSPENLSDKSDVFPEPESNREATKESYRFSIRLEDEISQDGVEEFGADVIDFNGDQMNDIDAQIVYLPDDVLGEDDDADYPEREYFPPNYAALATQDIPYASYPWDVPHKLLPTYALDSELPDDLLKETDIYPDFDKYFGGFTPAKVPTTSLTPCNLDQKLREVFGESF